MKLLRVILLLGAFPSSFAFAADDPQPAPDTTHQIIQYRAPTGWTASDPPGGATKVYTSPDSNVAQQAYLVIALTQAQENFDFPAAFDRAIKATAPGATIR